MKTNLVMVRFGDDLGMVSLKTGKVLFSMYIEKCGELHTDLPYVRVEDGEIAKYLAPDVENPKEIALMEHWENVPRLLKDKRFPLKERVEFLNNDDEEASNR